MSSFDIYYGNDCYGRGTYAGGEYNVCEAVREILKFSFSVAVFGQAFAYECGASFTEREIVQSNEDRFWLGLSDTRVVLATSAGFTDKIIGHELEIVDKSKAKEKMLNDWNIGASGHSGYGKW